ncbi:hypothetical protein [Ferrimonas sp. YFM]|uniref:hypothetical protein n=1 Tax=Ferrimonas sp. YFM TaxID=3028878 RepID=UPI0025727267|nr:hypothetical protein [Ferrimonas sp. YFM]BDY06743.1 hypothetical protein F0521_37840 [Ferrimonas sp. YFM]
MNLHQRVELRLKRDFSQLLTLVVVLAVMFLLLRGWNNKQPEIDRNLAYILQGRLVTSVNLARVSWMQQGRPKEIFWTAPTSDAGSGPIQTKMQVNDRGWPDPVSNCANWWSMMMGRELSNSNVTLRKDGKSCWVSFHSQPFLRYDSATGSVILLSDDE